MPPSLSLTLRNILTLSRKLTLILLPLTTISIALGLGFPALAKMPRTMIWEARLARLVNISFHLPPVHPS